jgi:hypothetical protein
VREEYSMDEVGGYVTLKVQSKFYGDEADEIRSYLKSNATNEIHKNYLNFYAKDYSEISLKKDVAFIDNKAENMITSSEQYLLKNFWTLDPEKGKTAYLYARVLSSYLQKPETKLRTMPLNVKHPVEIHQTIKIHLPEDWNIKDYKNEIESDGFVYRSSILYSNKVITLRYSYKTKATFVETESAASHISKMDEVLDDINYMIYKPLKDDTGGSQVYIVIAMLIGVAVFTVIKRYKR